MPVPDRPAVDRRQRVAGKGKGRRRASQRIQARRRIVLMAGLGLLVAGLLALAMTRRPAENPLVDASLGTSAPAVASQAELFASTLQAQERLVRHQHDHAGEIPEDLSLLQINPEIPVQTMNQALSEDGPPVSDLERMLGQHTGVVGIEKQGPARGRVWGIGRNPRGQPTVLVRLMPPVP